jgi:outer membrane protein OmpA-like peptidoglycan-associated protein/tetratricopeptide (TPR) repeat protein
MKYIFTVFTWLAFFSLTFAQNKHPLYSKEQIKKIQMADAYLVNNELKPALDIFEKLSKELPDNIEINFKVGFCYLHATHKEKSLSFLQKVYAEDSTYTSNIHLIYTPDSPFIKPLTFFMGMANQYDAFFKEAMFFYQKTIAEYEKLKADKKIQRDKDQIAFIDKNIAEARKRIAECKYGESYVNAPVNAQIDNIGAVINSKFADYAPVISADGKVLVFTSRRDDSEGGKIHDDGEHFEDVYIAYWENNQWTKPKNIGRPVNTNSHDASIAISPDGKEIFIYKDDNNGTGSIYFTDLKADGTWESPKSMGDHINTKFHEPSISMISDKKTVFFSSTRPGGLGGLDIYMSQKNEKGEWGEAIHLGNTINTEYDDDAPFITTNGRTLYFSSKGHTTMGGYDIFKSEWDGSKWSEPQNIGYPINTPDDDIYFVLSGDGNYGYYASAKEGGQGKTDIYIITMPQKINLEVAKIIKNEPEIDITPIEVKVSTVPIEKVSGEPKLILRGTITDKKTKEKLEANVSVELLANNASIDQTVSGANGQYRSEKVAQSQNYMLSVQKEGYLFHSETFSTPKITQDEEVVVDVELDRLKLGAAINLKIFFDFDKATIRKESYTELKRLLDFMQKYPTVKVEIGGHTDNIGTNQKNLILSDRRAKAVVDYLKTNLIPESRMTFKGYGYHKPIAPNQNQNGSDNPQGRQLNRRTECVVTAFEE